MAEISRREFLKFAAGGAAAAADAATKTVDKLIPYVVQPEEIRPGVWTFFATTCRECPAGCGMHLAHRDGRVTKAEPNPDHPVNLGGLCARGQSALQGHYDPDRVRHVWHRRADHPAGPAGAAEPERVDWPAAIARIASRLKAARAGPTRSG